MQALIVVDQLTDWPLDIPNVEIVEAKEYLMQSKYCSRRHTRVFNLCRSYHYQTLGYYVSLLAAARGHHPQPGLMVIEDLKSPSMIRFLSEELDQLVQNHLKGEEVEHFALPLYFGRSRLKKYDKLAQKLYQEFPSPLLSVQFFFHHGKWHLHTLETMAVSGIPAEDRPFVMERAAEFFAGKRASPPKRQPARFDLALLVNPEEKTPPSDGKAIQRFLKAAERVGFMPELIQKEDFGRLAEFDALFIRETTAVNHHTYRFARKALAEGLVVIDDPESILRCTNKVFLAELLEKHGVPTPKTVILEKSAAEQGLDMLPFPFVLKLPDSAFSQGVTKVDSLAHYKELSQKFFAQSDLLLAQEFLPTSFDWRIGLLDGEPLYACKYYMARKHWQIYEHHTSGKTYEGGFETFPISQVPKAVLRTAVKAGLLIGRGFYGVDLKEIDKQCYVIEVNDNPSIDFGIEDFVLQDELYLKIMQALLNRVEKSKLL
ncbi:MAG: hypothetical protein K0S07_1381 [Chlamydiales bacterium]|jgi:glutathione synthase/RimK-type ligase-like ATP-grasp enzyme|nr:hypothetical protein [Chlamydiales bacterium]